MHDWHLLKYGESHILTSIIVLLTISVGSAVPLVLYSNQIGPVCPLEKAFSQCNCCDSELFII